MNKRYPGMRYNFKGVAREDVFDNHVVHHYGHIEFKHISGGISEVKIRFRNMKNSKIIDTRNEKILSDILSILNDNYNLKDTKLKTRKRIYKKGELKNESH